MRRVTYISEGWGFDSLRARHFSKVFQFVRAPLLPSITVPNFDPQVRIISDWANRDGVSDCDHH